MKARVQKWGRSQALRIPRSIATVVGLAEDSTVELSLENGRLVVQPQTPPQQTLEELLRGVTADNRHAEWDAGPAVGKEVW